MTSEPDQQRSESKTPAASKTIPNDDSHDPVIAARSSSKSEHECDPIENTMSIKGENPCVEDTPDMDAPVKDTPKKGTPDKDEQSAEIPGMLGRFKIHGVLGQGGFGTVYLGFDERLKRKVAIKVPTKVLSGVELDKFLEEAQRLAQLRHPGIITVFDVGEFEGRCYIVSDYLEGSSLNDWMDSHAYGWHDAALITAQIADALAHAHAQGTVHRDVKPSNVMMLADGNPVLIDFGLAISDAHGERELPGMVAGTPAYMSPEQIKGKAHRIDGRTDIYALGVMLYHLLCRKRPFASSSRAELLRQIREDDPQPPRQVVPSLPLELEQICLKAMSKHAGDRFTTATDMAVALRQIAQSNSADAGKELLTATQSMAKLKSGVLSRRTSASSRLHDAERRQITTLHLDLEATAFDDEELDPERLHAVLQRIRTLTAQVIDRFGGHFVQSTSEAIQAYFGYPQAFEDSARRAVLAGLDMCSEIKKSLLRIQSSHELTIEFCVGIHTGIVVTEEVLNDVSSERHSIVGNVPRVASGLAQLAESGTVVVSSATRQIVGSAFAYRSLGVHSGKSIGRDVEVFVVDTQIDESSSLESEAAAQQTPLVGREHEMGILQERWRQANGGSGQIVILCADAGVGKSRLLAEFMQALDAAKTELFGARCSNHHQNTAFRPISDLLKRLAQITAEDSDESKLGKLEALLQRFDMPLDTVLPLFVDLLAVPLGTRYSVFEGTPERRKQKTIEAFVELALTASESQPLLFTVEDLHWSDPTTLQLLSVLIEQVPTAPILLVLTYRPTFTPPWTARPSFAQLMLGNLTDRQASEIVKKIAGGRELPAEVVDHILAKTGGVPLFTEELTKYILESKILQPSGDAFVLTRPLASVDIPGTLQDSLTARLDYQGSAKDVAQLAAVIGREFTFSLLAAIAPLDHETLQEELTCLAHAELIQQRGFFPRAKFTFKHALIQDAAYQSLLRKDRQQWHGRIANVLESQFPQIAEGDPELLAHHYTEAGQPRPAIKYWHKAAQQALERSAGNEAISHCNQGLALVDGLDESPERDVLAFQFQIPLGVALLTARGYAAPEVGPVFERARELGQKLAGPAEQFHIHWGIWAWRVVREQLQLCREMADEALRIVEPLADAGLSTEALFIPALTSFYLGDFATSAKCCEQGFALYDQEISKLHARHTGQNVGVTMQCYWALSLWHLGYPDQAQQRMRSASELARSLKHPFSLCYALGHNGWLHHDCRLGEEVKRSADEVVTVAKDQGFAFWLAEGTLHQGFGLLLDGQIEESLAALSTGLKIFNMTGAKLSLGHFYSMVAHAHLLAGDTAEAQQWIAQALQAAAANGNSFHLAEIHRLQGLIWLATAGDHQQKAEASFNESLSVARAQQAKSWELRTTISLCRLWESQNRRDEARQALATVYDWFQEGQQTPDLVDAKQLLDALQSDAPKRSVIRDRFSLNRGELG